MESASIAGCGFEHCEAWPDRQSKNLGGKLFYFLSSQLQMPIRGALMKGPFECARFSSISVNILVQAWRCSGQKKTGDMFTAIGSR